MEPRNVAAMIHRHNSVSNRIRGGKTEPLPSCHSEQVKRAEESSQVANFILWWFFHQRGGFLHSADAAVGMTYVSGLIVTDLNVQRFRLTPDGDESSPLHCVTPFNCTGYSRNVAGGRLPPLHARRWVIPFNRTGYICHAPGTAHRPFPTVSLKRSASAPIVPAMFHAVPHCPPLPVVGMTVRDTFYRPKPT